MKQLCFNEDQICDIANDLAQLRLRVDLNLSQELPYFSNKPYPLGRCREIRDSIFDLLSKELLSTKMKGLLLVKKELEGGAKIGKVWGSLRDQYFQNALLFNNWYIDTANDTVDANKPRVEMLLVEQSGFKSITSFSQFIKIAEPYWNVKIFKNTVCPALAPFMPLLCISLTGSSWLAAANDEMISLAMNNQFKNSKEILQTLPEPPDQALIRWSEKLAEFKEDPFLISSGASEAYCDQYLRQEKFRDLDFRNQAVISFRKIPKTISVL